MIDILIYASVDHKAEGEVLDIPKVDEVASTLRDLHEHALLLQTLKIPNTLI